MIRRPNQHVPQNYSGIFSRLISKTEEPENGQSCWNWSGRMHRRYPLRIRLRYRGKHINISPHRAMLTILDCEGETEVFGDLYMAYSVAEFEADHLCFYNPRCINPDHLQWLTSEEHKEKTHNEVHPDQARLQREAESA